MLPLWDLGGKGANVNIMLMLLNVPCIIKSFVSVTRVSSWPASMKQ